MDAIKRFFRKAFVAYKALFGFLNPQAYAFIMVINPSVQVAFFVLIARYVYNVSDPGPWIIGNSLLLTSLNALFGVAPQLNNEREIGTLKLLIASPTSNPGIFLPRAFFHMLDGIISVTIGLITGRLFFGFTMSPCQLYQFYLVISTASFSMTGLGMFISSFGLLTRDLNLIMNLITSVLLFATGANIPLDSMPRWIQLCSRVLPLTKSIELGKLIYQGEKLSQHLNLWGGEILIGSCYVMSGFLSFRIIEGLARKHATLEVL